VPSDATEKNCNIGVKLQSLLYTTAQKHFSKFTSYMTFGVHKLVRSETFLDSQCEILLMLYSEVPKNLYRCTSMFLALKYCSGLFLKSVISI